MKLLAPITTSFTRLRSHTTTPTILLLLCYPKRIPLRRCFALLPQFGAKTRTHARLPARKTAESDAKNEGRRTVICSTKRRVSSYG